MLASYRAPARGAGRISDDQLSPVAPPCALRPCPSSVRRPPARVGGQSGVSPEPSGSRPASPWPHSPPPRRRSPWTPPSRLAPTPGHPRPPARASSAAAVPPPLGPGSARRPWAPDPRATAAGAGSFSSDRHSAPPLTLRPGAGHEGPPRRGLRPAATCRPPFPAQGLSPPPLPVTAWEALRPLTGKEDSPSLSEESPLGPTAAGQPDSGRAEGPLGVPEWSAFLASKPTGPCGQTGTGHPNQ